MANEKKEYKPGIKKIKSFFKDVFAEKPGSPKAKRRRAKADVEMGLPKARPMSKSSVMSKGTESVSGKPLEISDFGKEFKKARFKGLDSFMFKGKSYSTVTKEDLGSKTLRQYLNEKRASKKKNT